MLHPHYKTLSPKSKTLPLGLFATFNPAISPSPEQKTQRISKQTIQPMTNNQTIADSLTFIPSSVAETGQEELITLKNINKKGQKTEQNSVKIDETQSWVIKKQVYADQTKIKERQPQLAEILASLKIRENQENRLPFQKKIYMDSLVRIQCREQLGELEDSEEIFDEHSDCYRKSMLSLNQTISIVFIPKEINRKVPFLSQKVDKKLIENDYDCSLLSRKSSFTPKSQSQQIALPKTTLIHLNQISILLHKDQKRNERINEFLHSNEKMLHNYRANKDQLDLYLSQMTKMKECFKALQHQLQVQKQKNNRMMIEKEQREKTILSLKALNERYLKDNNETKQKLKVYLKIIHELKLQLSQKQLKQQMNNLRGSRSTLNLNLDHKHLLNGANNDNVLPSHPMTTKNGRSHLDISQNIPGQKSNQKGFSKVNVQEKVKKINNSYSIPHFQDAMNLKKQMNGVEQRQQNLYSHRNITLTPNFFTQMTDQDEQGPKFGSGGSTINLKSPLRRNTLKLGRQKQKQVDKSLSGFSNLSGISACQKIGYIVKPRKENNIGELVDYLEIDNLNEERTFRVRNKTAWDVERR